MKLKYTALMLFAASMFFVSCDSPTENAIEDQADAMEDAADEVDP